MRAKWKFGLVVAGMVAFSGCGIQSSLDDMGKKVDATNDKIGQTNDAVHEQLLKFAIDDMTKPENTRYLQPPIDMIPGAKIFAENVHADELLLFAQDKFMQIQYGALNDYDASCHEPASATCTQAIYQLDLTKVINYSMLLSIAGFLPQSMVENIVSEQATGGEYEAELNQLLYLRYQMLADVRIGRMALAPGLKLSSLARVKEAVSRVSELQFIANLPFANRISLKITSLHAPFAEEYNLDGTPIDVTEPAPFWKKIDRAMDSDLGPIDSLDPVSREQLEALKAEVKSHVRH